MENNKMQVSTQIRTFYSEGLSCLTVKFYNMNLSFQFYPFAGKNQNGRSTYDTKNGETTTVDFASAYALFQASKDIIENKIQTINLSVPCGMNANLLFERKMNNNQFETSLTIQKNGKIIPFKFNSIQSQVTENGQQKTIQIESALGSFNKTIEGYLVGINSREHLNKLTSEYRKLQENSSNNQNNNNQYQRPNYQKNNNYNKNNNYQKKPFNNYQNNNYQKNNQYEQKTFSEYQIQN